MVSRSFTAKRACCFHSTASADGNANISHI